MDLLLTKCKLYLIFAELNRCQRFLDGHLTLLTQVLGPFHN